MLTQLLFLSYSSITFISALDLNSRNQEPWDLNGPCQDFVEDIAKAQADMVQCASNFSIPPKVCTNCYNLYINFKQIEYQSKNINNIYSLDNRTCSQVIYGNYLLTYVNDISTAVTNTWETSRCDSCLTIQWNLTSNSTKVDFNQQTEDFASKLFAWRDCIVNYTDTDAGGSLLDAENQHNCTICQFCKDQFNSLFTFYWDIYTKPGVQFCVDVETTMNDTLHIWNDVWQCAEKKDRQRETALVIYSSVLLSIFMFIFYAGSYIQGGGRARNLIQYSRSRMNPPEGQRSRLLSSSASDADLQRHWPGSSSQDNRRRAPS